MKLKIYQIDAFSDQPFSGNPAAVCPLEAWLEDGIMQSIAEENNLSETAFFVKRNNGFHIRWFTPLTEVDLCGHATLAAAHVIFAMLRYQENEIIFQSRSGELIVKRNKEQLEMNFPEQTPELCECPQNLLKAFNSKPIACLKAEDYILVFESEEEVVSAQPIYEQLTKLDLRGVIITAESTNFDFVSRFFAPKYGINEDPVTGSAHTQLTPYWSKRLSKKRLHAKQVSKRGGEIFCEDKGNRVLISGNAFHVMTGELILP